jgi:hypothetical protein
LLLQIKLSEPDPPKFSHDDIPPFFVIFKCFKRYRPLISTAHLPPAIKAVIMASEETIPIIVEFT